ncbi:MAG: hypothetical protein AB7G25_06135 [Sphingomonadaceae bacterium]
MVIIRRRQALKVIGVGGLIGMSATSPLFGSEGASAAKSGKDSSPGFMAMLIYTPRADAEARGYTKWIQEVDNPFFNGVDEISHYTNWLVTSGKSPLFPGEYFDFMVFKDRKSYDAAWSRRDVPAFAAGWTAKWGKNPDATAEKMSENYHVFLAERITPAATKTQSVDVTPLTAQPASPAVPSDTELWAITEGVLGKPRFSHLQIKYNDPGASSAPSLDALRAKIIATPD